MSLSILARLGLDSSDFKSGLSDASRQTSGFSSTLTSAVTSAAKLAGAALAGLAIKGTADMVRFQKGISEVFTLMPGISKAAMGQMEEDVRKLSVTMGIDLNDAVSSLYQAISAGVDPNNAIDFLKQSAKTAIGGVATLEDSVGALTTIINGYGMSAKEATRVSDVLFSVVKNGVTNMTELGQNIGKVTPIAASLGVTIEEVGAMFAVLTKQMGAGKTAEAGTAIRSMLAELAKEGMKANENFKALGKGGFKEFIANGGQVGEALMMMKENAEASGKSLMDLFRGVEAGNGALMLVTQGGKELSAQLRNVQQDAGATQTAFLPVLNDLIPKLSAGMKDFAPKMASVGRDIAKITETIIDLAPALTMLVKGLAVYTIGVKASAVATNLLGKSVKSAAGPLLALFAAFEIGIALGDGIKMLIDTMSGARAAAFDAKIVAGLNDEMQKTISKIETMNEQILALKKNLGMIKEEKPFEELEKLNLREQVDALKQMTE